MGQNDYDYGYSNPYANVFPTNPNWVDIERGQRDALKWLEYTPPITTSGGAYAPVTAATYDPNAKPLPAFPPTPRPAKRKKMGWAVVATIFAGPLGLFYASKVGGLVMLVVAGIGYLGALQGVDLALAGHTTAKLHRPGLLLAGRLVEPSDVWPLTAAFCIVWAMVGIILHNRKAAATDAANRIAWKAEADRILAEHAAK